MEVIKGDHDITPRVGTVRKADGSQGSMLRPEDYPLTARCVVCGGRVRVDRYHLAPWYHTGDDQEMASA